MSAVWRRWGCVRVCVVKGGSSALAVTLNPYSTYVTGLFSFTTTGSPSREEDFEHHKPSLICNLYVYSLLTIAVCPAAQFHSSANVLHAPMEAALPSLSSLTFSSNAYAFHINLPQLSPSVITTQNHPRHYMRLSYVRHYYTSRNAKHVYCSRPGT